jgi:signal transduction histidine kinase
MSIVRTSYCEIVGSRVQAERALLARTWLERLVALIPVEPLAVFPTNELLDHMPRLIEEIGKYVGAPEEEDIAAKTVVIESARELGLLRHRQKASVHQVLREYDLLAEVLHQFVAEETERLNLRPPVQECLDACRRVGRAVRVLMQTTVATFVTEYTETITRQAERLERFNRAVGHELRNVLGTLQFAAALLGNDDKALDASARQRVVATVRRNTERALQIVRSLERLPRTGLSPAEKPTEQVVELRELVGEVLRQLEEMAQARGVELRVTGDFPLLWVDTSRLELVLVNLISNAIKYSDPSKPHRFVEIAGRDGDGVCEIRVIDNGLGIPQDALKTIFERFARAHTHLDEHLGVEGSGLGLAIADECARALGAEITVESQEGVGTSFTVRLPKRAPEADAIRSS